MTAGLWDGFLGIGPDSNRLRMECLPARDRVGAFYLLGPDLNPHLPVGDDAPVIFGIIFVCVAARYGTADHVSKLKQIVPMRVLDFHLGDLPEAVLLIIDPALEIGAELVAKVSASTPIDDDNGLVQMRLRVFEDQATGVLVERVLDLKILAVEGSLVDDDPEVEEVIASHGF